MAPKRRSASSAGSEATRSKANGKGAGDSNSKSTRKILVTAGEGQTGRLIIDLLITDDSYANKYEELTALVFNESAKSVLEEYDTVKVVVFDPNDEELLVKSMEQVDTCLLIPPARKVRSHVINVRLYRVQLDILRAVRAERYL